MSASTDTTSSGRTLYAAALLALLLGSCALPGAASPSPHPATTSAAEVVPGLRLTRAQVDEAVRVGSAGDFVGVQVGVRHDGHLTVVPYGEADIEHARPVTARTRFGLGSVTKAVTAVALLEQVDAGRVALDTPVHEVLDGQNWPSSLTVEHLLTMTSGLSTDLGVTSSASAAATPARLRRIAGLPTAFPPGDRFRYDNNDYVVLGGVLESLTGESYAAVAARTLGRPRSAADGGGCSGPDLATPYAANGTAAVRVHPYPFEVTYSAGGLCGTASELLGWVAELAAGRTISAGLYRRMTTATPQSVAADTPTGYAFRIDSPWPGTAWKSGLLPDPDNPYGGYSAFLAWDAKTRTGVAVLANTAGPAGGVASSVGSLLVDALQRGGDVGTGH